MSHRGGWVSSAHLQLPVAQPQSTRHMTGRLETSLPRGQCGGHLLSPRTLHLSDQQRPISLFLANIDSTVPPGNQPNLLCSVSPLHLARGPGCMARLSLPRQQVQMWEATGGPEATLFMRLGMRQRGGESLPNSDSERGQSGGDEDPHSRRVYRFKFQAT